MVILLLGGCVFISAEDRASRIDADGDGFPSHTVGGDDCNDTNSAVGEATDRYADLDGDGFGAGEANPGCSGPTEADDCDDTDPDVNPAAIETCAGSTDQNCDGAVGVCTLYDFGPSIPGAHVEGLAGTAVAAADLDDDGHTEVIVGEPGYGGGTVLVIDPADYADDDTVWRRGDETPLAEDAYQDSALGSNLALADLDDDDVLDILSGEPGRGNDDGSLGAIAIVYGPMLPRDNPIERITAESSDHALGTSLVAGQFGGRPMLLAGAPMSAYECGAAYMVQGQGLRATDVYSAFNAGGSKFYGDCDEDDAQRLGQSAVAGDIDGDGLDDIFLGAPGHDVRADDAGAVWLVSGDTLEVDMPLDILLANTVAVRWEGVIPGEAFGSALALGDGDGNGTLDLAVGAPLADTAPAERAGAVYVYLEPAYGGAADAATWRFEGTDERAGVGTSLLFLPPQDGENFSDLAIGAPGEDEESQGEDVGAAWIVDLGGAGLSHELVADARLVCGSGSCAAGSSLAAGDVDGDDVTDLLVGAPGWLDDVDGDDNPDYAGGVAIVLGARWSR